VSHNDYLFTGSGEEFRFLRRFDDMYRNCEDPHGQSTEVQRIDYQIVLAVLDRAAGALASAPAPTTTRILDVGCGIGYFTSHVKRAFPEATVSGCDISPAAIEKARARAPECRFVTADLLRPESLPREEYDILLTMHVLCYFTEQEIRGVIANLRGLLAPGGFLLAGHHMPREMRFGRFMQSLEDARSLFGDNGFAMRFGVDIRNELDTTYAGDAVGRNLYFLVQKEGA
jgi:SAM-dependent methyltransferase